ncbi:quinolinate synthetase [Pelotomaculum sp. FP]|uniref:quinolinate synthase NadA n=1 Tax=Pelotomaculum sp. FP TaxID=261474 RepID=UPI001065788B|nr:quinolinate synthase NadA [Pelotomaculum sp. FP]TEB16394.1 quinolinate synthetase [Pelotomaculum sp. FP]
MIVKEWKDRYIADTICGFASSTMLHSVYSSGIIHWLIKEAPEKLFYMASERMVCPNMKKTTLESVHRALLTLQPRVQVPENVHVRAACCLERMLSIG